MATFRPCVQKQRADGFYPVYIRVTHDRRTAFMKTTKVVEKKSVTKNNEIRDNVVLKYCTEMISYFNQRLNMQDISKWSVKEVVSFLSTEESDASFSDYAKLHISRMVNGGHERNAKNYKLAVAHLERFMGTTQIMFSYLTTAVVQRWINSLMQKRRAKEMYPVCIRQIYKAALVELNDDERGICRIKFNPWLKIQIPKSDKTDQIAISAEECREFFNRPLPQLVQCDVTVTLHCGDSPLLHLVAGLRQWSQTVLFDSLKELTAVILYFAAQLTQNSRTLKLINPIYYI